MHMKSIALGLVAALALSGCAGGKTALYKAEKLEQAGNLDEAVVKFAEAAAKHPDVAEYRVKFLEAAEKASRAHFKKGEDFLAAKEYDAALREYQTAYGIDASFGEAQRQAEHVQKLRNARTYYNEGVEFEKSRKPREALDSYRHALEFDPASPEIKGAIEKLLATRKPRLDGFELNLKSTKPITLKFKDAKIKEIFNILTQLSGINFIFDDTLKDINVSLFLENASFQQALDVICGVNKLGRKVLNDSTIIIYPRTPDKNKQYEELVVRTFYLNKLDAKKAVNLIRTMLTVKKIYVNEEMNALVIRDTPEVIEVAGKILEANDVPDAEVLLEVEVFEIAKKNEETFGLALSKYAVSAVATNPNGQIMVDSLSSTTTGTSTGTGTTTTQATPQNLLNFFAYKGFNGYLTVPNATFNFGKTLANGETLSNPRIRVKNREKAKFNVGTRVPITTTSSPSGGGVSVNVQYVDVGVKVNAEPTIQLNNEVSIKLGLEVSSILQKDTIGTDQATTVVTIGTRNLDTVLSLKDGETSIIGGLIQNIKNDSKDKISLLGDIPILGSLFSNTNKSTDKTELMLAITPHIVRGVTVPEGDVANFWSGREDDPSTEKPYASFVEPDFPEQAVAPQGRQGAPAVRPAAAMQPAPVPPAPAAQPAPPAPAGQPAAAPQAPVQPAPAGQPAVPVPAGQVPVPAPQPQPQAVPVPAPVPVPTPAANAAVPAPTPAPAPAATSKVFLNLAAPASVKAGDQFSVQVSEAGAKNLYNVVYTVAYDPKLLDVVDQKEGPFLKQGKAPSNFQAYPDRKKGELWVSQSRTGAAAGADGDGILATVTFKALAKGGASLGLTNANFSTQTGDRIDVVPFNSVVEVK